MIVPEIASELDHVFETPHTGDVAALVFVFVICTALSVKVFRWE